VLALMAVTQIAGSFSAPVRPIKLNQVEKNLMRFISLAFSPILQL